MDSSVENVINAIKRGARINEEVDEQDQNGLLMALRARNYNVAEFLLVHTEIDINKLDASGCSAISIAVKQCNPKIVKLLMKREDLTTINTMNGFGMNPIMEAVYHKCEACLNLMLANPKVNLDVRDTYQRSQSDIDRYLFQSN